MIYGTLGREIRIPIHDALEILSKYINVRLKTAVLTANDYDVYSSNNNLDSTTFYLITDGIPNSVKIGSTSYKKRPIDDAVLEGYYGVAPEYWYDESPYKSIIYDGRLIYHERRFQEERISISRIDEDDNFVDSTNIASMLTLSNARYVLNTAGEENDMFYMYIGNSVDVTEIDDEYFKNIPRLRKVHVGNQIKRIGEYAFEGTGFLDRQRQRLSETILSDILIDGINVQESIDIPDYVRTINTKAFIGNLSLTSVGVPYSLKNIGDYAFSGCTRLSYINIDGVSTIGSGAFMYTNIPTISIPGTVDILSDEVFAHSGVSNVTINEGVTQIGNRAFYDCSMLKNIDIPSTVTSIGENTFYREYPLLKTVVKIRKPEGSIPGAPWGLRNDDIIIWNWS